MRTEHAAAGSDSPDPFAGSGCVWVWGGGGGVWNRSWETPLAPRGRMGSFACKKVWKNAVWASEFGRGFVQTPNASLPGPFP